jgi:hypothetical protein
MIILNNPVYMECVENNISTLRKMGFIVDFEKENSSISSVGSV